MNRLAPSAAPASLPTPLSRFKRVGFGVVLVSSVVVFGLGVGEWALRLHDDRIRRSESLDEGFSQYDPRLGWRLTPLWEGNHRHYDYRARYRIDVAGFRAEAASPPTTTGPAPVGQTPSGRPLLAGTGRIPPRPIAVVGDSFTFGFGVDDDQTFVAELNRRSAGRLRFVNYGVPGYSTDQEILLVEQEILPTRPEAIILVVFLGNDIIDNAYPFPMQGRLGKPRFVLGPSGLELANVPVPARPKVGEDSVPDLKTAVLGPRADTASLAGRMVRRSAWFRVFGEDQDDLDPADFERRFEPNLALFEALLVRLAADCKSSQVSGPEAAAAAYGPAAATRQAGNERSDAVAMPVAPRLELALLAGRSFVERPRSLSARYQELLRSKVLQVAGRHGIRVVDLATEMQTRWSREHQPLYYRHDGHLRPAGHRVVADLLLAASRVVRGRFD